MSNKQSQVEGAKNTATEKVRLNCVSNFMIGLQILVRINKLFIFNKCLKVCKPFFAIWCVIKNDY